MSKRNESISPTSGFSTIRMLERHITAYPSCINYTSLPRDVTDPPTTSLEQKNEKATCPKIENSFSSSLSIPRTTNQVTRDITRMAFEMGMELNEKKKHRKKVEKEDCQDSDPMTKPIGFRIGLLAPPYDVRTTYRLDYTNRSDETVPKKNNRKNCLINYRKTWNTEESIDVDQSARIPYLTIPGRICNLKPTMYRSDYMPYASRNEFRMLPHQVNLPGIRTDYAYSAYTSDDPRRDVLFDPDVASITSLRSALYKSYAPYRESSRKEIDEASLREYLAQLRKSMLHAHQRLNVSQRVKSTSHGGPVPKLTRTVVIPGNNGCPSQCIPLNPENYIALPREHFGHRPVYDY